MKPTVIDLFAGVGGLSLGFEMAGFEVALANEYDPSIAEAYMKNRPNTKMIVEDITKLPVEETFGPYEGKVTVVIGGPPCQGFSQKGMRKSVNDPRNFLFRYYFEVVKKVKPGYFVIENVPNLLTTENGYFKDEIVELFSGIGYAVSCGVLCAADFGVPQDRHRTCIMGKLGADKPEAKWGAHDHLGRNQRLKLFRVRRRRRGAELSKRAPERVSEAASRRLFRALQSYCDATQQSYARKAQDDCSRTWKGDAAGGASYEVDL